MLVIFSFIFSFYVLDLLYFWLFDLWVLRNFIYICSVLETWKVHALMPICFGNFSLFISPKLVLAFESLFSIGACNFLIFFFFYVVDLLYFLLFDIWVLGNLIYI